MAEIGAQATSRDTYATVKLALDAEDTGYHARNYSIFLQGSYGNDTNIIKESDVDVVIRLDSIFSYDLSSLPQNQRDAFMAVHPAAPYNHTHFKQDVLAALRARFGDHVTPGFKAVAIAPLHNRRKSDVLIAIQHRKYSWYTSAQDDAHVVGISFYKADDTQVVNYPRQHHDNLVAKNQETGEWLKHVIRIFKNARQRMVADGYIAAGIAPSYYIECLLYNVPSHCFGSTYADSVVNCINWLHSANVAEFVCANRQYRLLDGNPDVTWNSRHCSEFLHGLAGLWKGW